MLHDLLRKKKKKHLYVVNIYATLILDKAQDLSVARQSQIIHFKER